LNSRIAGEFKSSSQAQKHYDELKNKVNTLEKSFESANKAYNDAKVKYAENTAEIKTVISDIESLENEKVRLSKKFSELITQYGFKNNEEYQASKADDEKIYNLSEEINNYKTELSVIALRRNELSAQLENSEKCDISALEIKKKQLSDEYSKKDKERVKLFGICEQNNKVIKKLEKLADERNRLREEWAVISDLSKTANGNQGSGKAKFSLETYIQQYYFKQVIASANKRLTLLTDGMFVLRCKDKAKNLKQQVGLDLDVLDRSTGQWRDVSTLSGGESFLASISLALGLSDIVQSGNGGIQLDSMFIDEGFGTLDDNALSQAIALLDKLSDGKRLIGIISHVTELKNRIDKKIIVSKEAMGSRLKIEI
jgi:exonuclease SbcC